MDNNNAKELLAVVKQFVAYTDSNTVHIRQLFTRALNVIKNIGTDDGTVITREHFEELFFIVKGFISHTDAVTEHEKQLLIRSFRILKIVHEQDGIDVEKWSK
jgi:hypothetical protein